MSINKKYVYVQNCSLGETNDNFRNALGRTWVESDYSGLQYGYDIESRPFDMSFGPVIEWSHDYFKALEMPAKTQVVSVVPNLSVFPLASDPRDLVDIVQGDVEPCCGWDEYLNHFFRDHFSKGNPASILKVILGLRKANYRLALSKGKFEQIEDPFYERNTCDGTLSLSDDLLIEIYGEAGLAVDPKELPLIKYGPRIFRDLWFELATPFSQPESSIIEGSERALVADIDFDYNFFLEQYERRTTLRLPEIRIPNLYLTVGSPSDVPYVVYLKNNAKCRFEDFSKLVLQRGYRDILFPIKQLPFLQDRNEYSSTFPMDATIKFGTDRSTFVADALEDSKMECVMLRRASEGELLVYVESVPAVTPVTATRRSLRVDSTQQEYTPPRERGDQSLDFTFSKRFLSTVNTSRNIPSGPYTREVQTFDFYSWLMTLPDLPPSAVPLPGDHIFLGNKNDSTDMALRSGLYQTKMSYLANYFILSGKINDIARANLRSYQQVMVGNTPHSETILYRISKYSTAVLKEANIDLGEESIVMQDTSGFNTSDRLSASSEVVESVFDLIETTGIQPIQNIWIPNSNTVDIVEYVDTQVKYNVGYTYTVTAYQLSVGTEYFYSQYSRLPEPKPCPDQTPGVIDRAGPFTDDQIQSILDIVNNEVLDEGTKYRAIEAELEGLSPGFNSNGSHIAIIYDWNTEYVDTDGDGEPDSTIVTKFWHVVSYCVQIDLTGRMPPYAVVMNVPPAGTPHTPNKNLACEVFASMERRMVVAERGTGVLAGDTSSHSTRFRTRMCPDGPFASSKQGERETSVQFTAPVLENTGYVVRDMFDVKCECFPAELCRETFLVTTIPTLKVHQVPYFVWSGRVTDSYPVAPDIEPVPYRAVNNEMLFLVGAGVGSYLDKPIPIFPSDRRRFRDLLIAQKSTNGLVEFRSDDPVRAFQVFTTTTPPKNYQDFASAQSRVYSVKVEDRRGQKADAVSFIDKLEPNKKYYYTFRSMDVHGHISNPTPVYQIEMVDSDGAIYPLVSLYEIVSYPPADTSKGGQRLVQIRADYLQSLVDENQIGLSNSLSAHEANGNIKLSTRDEKLWEKRFKIRFTSCETKRAMDINVKFKTEHLENEICPPPQGEANLTNSGLRTPRYDSGLMDGKVDSSPSEAPGEITGPDVGGEAPAGSGPRLAGTGGGGSMGGGGY